MNKLCPLYVPRKKKATAVQDPAVASPQQPDPGAPQQAEDANDAEMMDRLPLNNNVDSDDEFFDAFEGLAEEGSDTEDPYTTGVI